MAKRGWLPDLLEHAGTLGLRVDTTKLLPNPYAELCLDDLPERLIEADFDLDDDQRTGIWLWLTKGVGVNQACVSAGKTAMFCGAIAFARLRFPTLRTLYLVPTERLVRQVTTEARKFLPELEIGQYGGGKHECDAADVVVATGAMIGAHFEEHRDSGWFKTFGALCCDESHRVAGDTMQSIVNVVPAYFRWGASDTTKEDDADAFALIKGSLGPVLHRVESAPLIEIGRIAKPKIYLIDVPGWEREYAHLRHTPEPGSPAWVLDDGHWRKVVYKGQLPLLDANGDPVMHTVKVDKLDERGRRLFKAGFPVKEKVTEPVWNEGWHMLEGQGGHLYEAQSRWCLLERVYDKAIILNKDRNNLIAEWTQFFSNQDKQTLVVCTRTLHVMLLEHLIKDRVDPKLVKILFSVHQSKERDETFDWLRLTPGAVLISPLVKEGVSINEIKAGVIADHVVSKDVARQIIGRYIRKKRDGANEAEIVWFIDRQHPRLARNSTQLFTELEKIRGYTYYHPCHHPSGLASATCYEAVAVK